MTGGRRSGRDRSEGSRRCRGRSCRFRRWSSRRRTILAPWREHANSGSWGSAVIESGEVGHINVASGHGPWPDGLLAFGIFLQRLSARRWVETHTGA